MSVSAPPEEAVRNLPRNIEAEAALLGALMIDNRIVESVAETLDADHFFEPMHGRIYAAIKTMRARDQLATPITLRPMFEADEAMREVSGPAYLAGLTGSGAGLIGARDFAKQIVDLAKLRAIATVAWQIAEQAVDTAVEVNPDALIERAEALLSSVVTSGTTQKSVSFADAWSAAIRRTRAVAAGSASKGAMIAHLKEWNEITGGMSPGQFILLGGRPGMGKTAVALGVARGAAEAGHGVLFVSREMPVEQLMLRMIADMMYEAGSTATFDDILSGRISEADFAMADEIRARIESWPLVFEEPPRLNVSSVAPMIRKHKRQMAARGQTLAVTVVDYLGLLDPPAKRGNREQEMGDVSRELKNAALATKTCVLALAQLNRGVEARDDKRPVLADLRESGSLEQDADTVVFAYRAEYYLRQSEPDPTDTKKRDAWDIEMGAARDRLDIYSAKVRQGEPTRRRVYFFGRRQAVRSGDFYRNDTASFL